MNIKGYKTLAEATKELRKRAFNTNLTLSNNYLKSNKTGRHYRPEDMRLVEVHRFKEVNSSTDFSMIFALFCHDGTKGLVVSSGKSPSDMNLIRFMDKVKIVAQTPDRSKAA